MEPNSCDAVIREAQRLALEALQRLKELAPSYEDALDVMNRRIELSEVQEPRLNSDRDPTQIEYVVISLLSSLVESAVSPRDEPVDDTPPNSRPIWKVSAIIQATEEEAERAAETIGLALCPDPHHEGFCPVPWTTIVCRFELLEEEEQASWRENFKHEAGPDWLWGRGPQARAE